MGWEPAFDEPWFNAFARLQRPPDVLLLSSGIWDMQYPPESKPEAGLGAFNRSLQQFIVRLQHAIDASVGLQHAINASVGSPGARVALPPRLFWLTVTGVSNRRLPIWKRPLMTSDRAREYNKLAEPLLRSAGVDI